MFTCLALCLGLLPGIAITAGAANGNSVFVGGVELKPSDEGGPVYAKTDPDGSVTLGGSEGDYNVKWDDASSTLTLKNAILQTGYSFYSEDFSTDFIAGIYSSQHLNLQLAGENQIFLNQVSPNSLVSIFTDGLTLSGSGTMDVSISGDGSIGVASTNQTMITGGTLNIEVTGNGSLGLISNDKMTITGGTLNSEAKSERSCGVVVYSEMTIAGGTVAAAGNDTAVSAQRVIIEPSRDQIALETGSDELYAQPIGVYDSSTDVTGIADMFQYFHSYVTTGQGTVDPPVYGVTLSHRTLALATGEHITLTATVAPSEAPNKAVIWESDDPSVASVDGNGLVTAEGIGEATITVTTQAGGYEASCTVTVTESVQPVRLVVVDTFLYGTATDPAYATVVNGTVAECSPEDAAIIWDGARLTLRDAEITVHNDTVNYYNGINVMGVEDLTLNLIGSNFITVTNSSSDHYYKDGIQMDRSLTVTGDGSLTVSAPRNGITIYGALNIEGGEITASGGSGVGIYANYADVFPSVGKEMAVEAGENADSADLIGVYRENAYTVPINNFPYLHIVTRVAPNLYVGGVGLCGSKSTGGTAYARTDPAGNVTPGGSEDDFNIKWDGTTLTLQDAVISGVYEDIDRSSFFAAIYRKDSFNIRLLGRSTITLASPLQDDLYGILSEEMITIDGSEDASLTIQKGAQTCGISAYKLIVKGGSVSAAASGVNSCAILADSMTVSGGNVTASGDGSHSCGIDAESSFELSSGTVMATASGEYSRAIRADSMAVSGGNVTATGDGSHSYGIDADAFQLSGGNVIASGSQGLYADSTFSVEGGTVDAKGTDGNGIRASGIHISTGNVTAEANGEDSCGLLANDTLEVSGGTVTATADGKYAWGISAYNVTIEGGNVTATTDGESSLGIYSDSLLISSNAAVTVTASGPDSRGILSYTFMEISGGTLTLTTTGQDSYGIDGVNQIMINPPQDVQITVLARENASDTTGGTLRTFEERGAFELDLPYQYIHTSAIGSGEIPVTGVELDKTSLTLTKGATASLTATVKPANATDQTVTWTSSNPAVATVSQTGTVTAIGAGTSAITAKAGDKTASCSVTVSTSGSDSTSGTDSDPSYSVSLSEEAEGGSISVKKHYAEPGETFYFTVTPDEGYELEKVTVTDSRGRELDLTYEGGREYSFKMPTGQVDIKVSFRALDAQSKPLPFADVAGNTWYTQAVRYVYDHGLMAGTSATAFSPDATTSRSMIATILWNMAGRPVVDYAMDFSDVAQGQWYSEAIRWAASEGIVSGYGDTFGINDPITREQFALMLWNYAGKPAPSGTLPAYPDQDKVSSWAVPAMTWCVEQGILSNLDGMLSPQGNATRAQAAVMLMQFAQQLP